MKILNNVSDVYTNVFKKESFNQIFWLQKGMT